MITDLSPQSIVRERYRIDGLIGQGGMGAVYRVSDLRLPGRLCALKIMRPQPAGLPGQVTVQEARQQFLIEASTLARLDHPNLPKVSDYFTYEDCDCLVMDYVPGQDLQQCIQDAHRRGKFLPLADVLDWMEQLCDVLQYLHEQRPPIVHGDVKPANIKLTAGGRLKLVDFGLVRPGDPEDPRTLTGAGLRGAGSLPYAALEQYAGSVTRADPRSDLYSLGATLYHLVTNQTPASAHERFLDPAALVPACQINPELPDTIEQAIQAAMSPHPKDRPQCVRAWRELLPGATPQPFEPAGDISGSTRATLSRLLRGNAWYILLAALLVITATVLTFWR